MCQPALVASWEADLSWFLSSYSAPDRDCLRLCLPRSEGIPHLHADQGQDTLPAIMVHYLAEKVNVGDCCVPSRRAARRKIKPISRLLPDAETSETITEP